MAPRKHGNRETYNKVRKAQARVRKLAKKGLISEKTRDKYIATARVKRSGDVTFGSKALNNALADYFAVLEGYERLYTLTRDEQAALLEAYSYLPEEERPRIVKGRISIAKGQYLSRSKKGGQTTVRIKHSGERRGYDLINVGPNRTIRDIENDVRDYYAAHKNTGEVGFEITENGPGSARTYFSTPDDILAKLEEYKAAGKFDNAAMHHIRLVRFADRRRDQIKREDWLKSHSETRDRKPRKAKPLTERQKAIAKVRMREKRRDPAFRSAEKLRRKAKRDTAKAGRKP